MAARSPAKRPREPDARTAEASQPRLSGIGNAYDRVDAEIQRLRAEINATGKKALLRG